MSEKKQMSQATIIGRPPPETWQELARDCIGAFGGGHQTSEARRIFHHGIQTVFNLLEGEFPSLAEVKGIEGLRAEVARLTGELEAPVPECTGRNRQLARMVVATHGGCVCEVCSLARALVGEEEARSEEADDVG